MDQLDYSPPDRPGQRIPRGGTSGVPLPSHPGAVRGAFPLRGDRHRASAAQRAIDDDGTASGRTFSQCRVAVALAGYYCDGNCDCVADPDGDCFGVADSDVDRDCGCFADPDCDCYCFADSGGVGYCIADADRDCVADPDGYCYCFADSDVDRDCYCVADSHCDCFADPDCDCDCQCDSFADADRIRDP